MTKTTLNRLMSRAVWGCALLLIAAAPGARAGEDDAVRHVEEDPYALLGLGEEAAVSPGVDPAFLVLPRATERSTMPDQLLTPLTEEMIEEMLTYLSNRQDPDGGWSDTQFESNAGVTALVCLALMAEGSRPRIGRFGRQIDLGMEFLLNHVEDSGVIAARGRYQYGPMYSHIYSMLAMLYAYGDMPWRGETQDVLARGIQAVQRSQKLDGGWRYQFSREGASDMSVTGNVLWVLRTAKKCGFTVDSEAIAKGVEYIQQCALPDGTFRYRVWGLEASPSLGGTGIIALVNDGRLDHPLIMPARDRIEYDYRRYTVEDLKERRFFVYGAWYASIAMYMSGDDYWIPWFEKTRSVLRAMQRSDGEVADEFDNTVYTTAMAAMLLQTPYGFLPLYER